MPDTALTPAPIKGAVIGLVSGLAAAAAMNGFQALTQKLASQGEGGGEDSEPATQKAADRVAMATTGQPVADPNKAAAGNLVHYVVGAALGIGYGVAAEYRPGVTAGYGSGFGLGTAALLDETAVPAAGLGPAPWKTSAGTHANSIASHLVFGTAAEAVRRLLWRLI